LHLLGHYFAGGNISYHNNILIPIVGLVPHVTVEVTQKLTSDPLVSLRWYLQLAYFLLNFFQSLFLHYPFTLQREQLLLESSKSDCYVGA